MEKMEKKIVVGILIAITCIITLMYTCYYIDKNNKTTKSSTVNTIVEVEENIVNDINEPEPTVQFICIDDSVYKIIHYYYDEYPYYKSAHRNIYGVVEISVYAKNYNIIIENGRLIIVNNYDNPYAVII